jgi:hypothetical protein
MFDFIVDLKSVIYMSQRGSTATKMATGQSMQDLLASYGKSLRLYCCVVSNIACVPP